MNLSLVVGLFLLVPFVSYAESVNCFEAYKKEAKCERIACGEKFKSFIGTWTGPFEAFSKELSKTDKSVFRPFNNTITYSEKDCLKNIGNGDVFIIGRRSDVYPAHQGLPPKVENSLLITGQRSDGSAFLKTIDAESVNEYKLVFKNSVVNMSAWSVTVPGTLKMPEMTFNTIDSQDLSETATNKRHVVVTMSMGPEDKPVWQGIVSRGFHTLKK